MRKMLLGAAVAVLLSGCAAKLTPRGAMVREVAAANVEELRATCAFLGVVEASSINWIGESDTANRVLTQVRNRVAEMGGDAFVYAGGSVDRASAAAQVEAYNCGTQTPPQLIGA